MYFFIDIYLLFTTTLHLPRERWRQIQFPPSENFLISRKGVILGEDCITLTVESSHDDIHRCLHLVMIHLNKVLTMYLYSTNSTAIGRHFGGQ